MNSSAKHIVCILASGASLRFGRANKLLSPFYGQPLIAHSIANVSAAGFDRIFCIVPQQDKQLQKVCLDQTSELILNPESQRGRGYSLVLAARKALELGASSMLIALADMPFVGSQHFINLRNNLTADNLVVSSDGDAYYGSPVLFSAGFFQQLLDLRGDQGGKTLISDSSFSTSVLVNKKQLLDIDTPTRLQQLST